MNELEQELKELKNIRDNIDKKYQAPIQLAKESKSIFDDLIPISKDIESDEQNFLYQSENANNTRDIMMSYFALWNFEKNKKEFETMYPDACKNFVDSIKENKSKYKTINLETIKEKDITINQIANENEKLKQQIEQLKKQNVGGSL